MGRVNRRTGWDLHCHFLLGDQNPFNFEPMEASLGRVLSERMKAD